MEKLRLLYGEDARYRINCKGEVFYLFHKRKGVVYWLATPKKVKRWKDTRGYEVVNLVSGYGGRGHQAYVHRLLYQAFKSNISEKRDIDHINMIKDDNRIENLRAVTRTQNNVNSVPRSGRKYKGVTEFRRGQWQARLSVTEKGVKTNSYIGVFDSPVKAAVAYDLAALRKYGINARTNLVKIADTIDNGM